METVLQGVERPALFRPRMMRAEFTHIGFLIGLMAIISIPLVGSKLVPALNANWVWMLASGSFVALTMFWVRTCELTSKATTHEPISRAEATIAILSLFGLSLVAFAWPQSVHFWGGYDDFSAFHPTIVTFWSEKFDLHQGRPLLGLSYYLGSLLCGGRIEGFLGLASLLCFANASLVWAGLRLLVPRSQTVAMAAAILFIINRSDPLKFYPLWAANPYGLGVFCFLLASVLLVYSWQRQNRIALVAACASLACSLLMYEVGYLLAGLPVVLLWLDRQRCRTVWVWLFAWMGTTGLMAGRFILFLLCNGESYQLKQAAKSGGNPELLLENFLRHAKGLRTYWEWPQDASVFSFVSIMAFALAFLGVILVGRRAAFPRLLSLQMIAGVSFIGIILAVAPYTHLDGNERTQFFSMPFQATLMISLMALAAYLFPERMRTAVIALGVGLLVASSTAQSFSKQQLEHHVTYDKAVHVCDQIRSLSSELTEQDLVVLLHRGRSPFGVDYAAFNGGPLWVGAPIVQIGDAPNANVSLEFREDHVQLIYFGAPHTTYDYQRLYLFELEPDGTLHFHSRLPDDDRLPMAASRYAPLEHLKASKVKRRLDFDYPAWSRQPEDIVNQREGELLGRGWSSFKFEGGWLVREASQNAEIIVNGQGATDHVLALDIEPLIRQEEFSLQVLDATGTQVAKIEAIGQTKTQLRLPVQADRVNLFTFHCPGLGKNMEGAALFRARVGHGPLQQNPLREEPDITLGGLRLGNGWYACEVYQGKPLRWLSTDGVLFSGPCEEDAEPGLRLEVNPGPGMDGKPCEIQLLGSRDEVLGSQVVTQKQPIEFSLPRNFEPNQKLVLRVIGGGKLIPGDPRTLNVQVTECRWLNARKTN